MRNGHNIYNTNVEKNNFAFMKPFCQHLVSDPDFATVKGGLVSEGIFTLVPPSKQCEKSLSSSSHPEVKKLRIGILLP